MVVLPSALVIDYVCLVMRDCEGTRAKNSKRVNKKPVLQLRPWGPRATGPIAALPEFFQTPARVKLGRAIVFSF